MPPRPAPWHGSLAAAHTRVVAPQTLVLPLQAAHAAPFLPQAAALVPATHSVPMQQPLQVAGSHIIASGRPAASILDAASGWSKLLAPPHASTSARTHTKYTTRVPLRIPAPSNMTPLNKL